MEASMEAMEAFMEVVEAVEASMEASVEAFMEAVEAVEASVEAAEISHKSERARTPRRSRDLALPLPSNLAPNQRPVT